MSTRIRFRRDTAANWTSSNPTLTTGELGYETNTGKFKIGDNATAWTSLAYSITAELSEGNLNDLKDVTITSAANGDLVKWNGSAWVNAAGYALLASPALTGTPSAPTAAALTNTTQIATTAFVTAAVGGATITSLDDVADVTITSAANGDLLKWNGTAWVNAAGYALLASPTFTGVPAAPTAAASTNTTQVATTAFVRAEVAALVNSAGATLDTLGEIATALGNDAALSTTLTTSIGLKAPLASPTFTGTVTIPSGASISGFAPLASPTFTGTPTIPTGTIATTQTAGNNTTAVATTAFVTTAVAGVAVDFSSDQAVLAGAVFNN